jgi:hypothetical protein
MSSGTGSIVEQSPLPSRHAVRTLVEDLVGRGVELADGRPVPPKSTNVVAVYVTDKLAVSALAVVDLEGAARLGGALGMIPRGGVDDAIDERELPDLLRENCYEVLNVLSALFNLPGAPHVRLYEMYGPSGSLPPDIAALSGAAGQRMDLSLVIAGYGPVQLSIVVR